eukprot:SAG22_NODE_1367_length_4592_cov_15.327436_3_plen_254_part_00
MTGVPAWVGAGRRAEGVVQGTGVHPVQASALPAPPNCYVAPAPPSNYYVAAALIPSADSAAATPSPLRPRQTRQSCRIHLIAETSKQDAQLYNCTAIYQSKLVGDRPRLTLTAYNVFRHLPLTARCRGTRRRHPRYHHRRQRCRRHATHAGPSRHAAAAAAGVVAPGFHLGALVRAPAPARNPPPAHAPAPGPALAPRRQRTRTRPPLPPPTQTPTQTQCHWHRLGAEEAGRRCCRSRLARIVLCCTIHTLRI